MIKRMVVNLTKLTGGYMQMINKTCTPTTLDRFKAPIVLYQGKSPPLCKHILITKVLTDTKQKAPVPASKVQ